MLRVLGSVAVATTSLVLCPTGDATAFPGDCPDVEVVFARGLAEPPGVGAIGQSFVDALHWQVGGQSYAVYPVNYPALPDPATTADGVVDASNHVRDTAAACPNTQMVLGGFSRGAAVIGSVTESPLPPEVADHVAAVVLLGKPSNELLNSRGVAPIVIGPGYAAKTIELCAAGDPVCSAGTDDAAHGAYLANGMTVQAADFAAQRLRPPEIDPSQPV